MSDKFVLLLYLNQLFCSFFGSVLYFSYSIFSCVFYFGYSFFGSVLYLSRSIF